MSKTREIEPGVTVYEESISDELEVTRDANAEGYLLTDGTNRSIRSAITTDGNLILFVTTNAGECIIADDLDDQIRICYDMGDAPDDPYERVKAGAWHIVSACGELGARYETEDAATSIEWFRDAADAVVDWADNESTDRDEAIRVLGPAGERWPDEDDA